MNPQENAAGRELSDILDLVAQMDAVDTAGWCRWHPLDMAQRLRSDVVSEQDRRNLYQAGARRSKRPVPGA